MTLLVSVCRISRPIARDEMETFRSAQREVFGDATGPMTFLPDPNDPHQAAIVGQVKDLEKMREISRTPEGDAMMRRFGFVEQLSYFLEEA